MGIGYDWKVLRTRRREFSQCRGMERLGIAATQGECADILGIERLPAHRYLRLLRIILATYAGNKRLEPERQHRRGILTVPFLSLGKVHFEAIEGREVPRGTGEWHPYFLVDSPDIPVHPEALPVRRANGVKGGIERITIARKSRRVVLAANGKRDRTSGKIKQIAVECQVTYRQLIRTRVMQVNINACVGRQGISVEKTSERIERRGWICIQQRIAQPGLSNLADRDVLSLVDRITETRFPAPGLKVIANESHFATQANVKQLVPIGEFFTPWAGIVEAAEPDSGSHRNRGSVNNNSGVANCERIKRILDRHTDAEWTTRPYGRERRTVNTVNSVEWIGRKRHRSQRGIEK